MHEFDVSHQTKVNNVGQSTSAIQRANSVSVNLWLDTNSRRKTRSCLPCLWIIKEQVLPTSYLMHVILFYCKSIWRQKKKRNCAVVVAANLYSWTFIYTFIYQWLLIIFINSSLILILLKFQSFVCSCMPKVVNFCSFNNIKNLSNLKWQRNVIISNVRHSCTCLYENKLEKLLTQHLLCKQIDLHSGQYQYEQNSVLQGLQRMAYGPIWKKRKKYE